MERQSLHRTPGVGRSGGTVVPLNRAGAVFDALATEIRGSAADWSPAALQQLEAALTERYGHLIGGPEAVELLLLLAQEDAAA